MKALIIVSVLALFAITTACQQQSAPKPGKFTSADIAKLKWIEGTWRGSGETQPFFYERYRFEGDTLVVDSFENETLERVADTGRFELNKDGEFGQTSGNSRSAATEITDSYVQFIPITGMKNAFRFEKQTDGTWRAVLETPATADKPAKTVIYKMEPWPRK